MVSNMLTGIENCINIKIACGVAFGILGYFVDLKLIPSITALTVLAIIDLIGAFLARGEFTEPFSRPIRKTGHKLAGYFVSISSVFIISTVLSQNTGIDIGAFDDFLVGFFLIHEVISIIENLNKAGIPIPLPFLNKLKKVRDVLENK